MRPVILVVLVAGATAVSLSPSEHYMQMSHVADGKASGPHSARISLLMAEHPQATRDLCAACVSAEDYLVGNQTATSTAQDALAAAQTAYSTANGAYDTCLLEESTAQTNANNAKASVVARLTAISNKVTSIQLQVAASSPEGALSAAGSNDESFNIIDLITAWKTSELQLTIKKKECAVLLVTKTTAAGIVTSANSTVLAAKSSRLVAQGAAKAACDAMRAGGYGAPTVAPTVAPTAVPTAAPTMGWKLAMNINPTDGHNSGWAGQVTDSSSDSVAAGVSTYWDSDIDYGSVAAKDSADFKDKAVFGEMATYILIARHQGGVCEAYKAWQLATPQSLLNLFQTSYRSKISSGSEVAISNPSTLTQKSKDPVFYQDNTALMANWYYSNNGARLTIEHDYMSPEGTNDDKTQGLGMDYQTHMGKTAQSGSSGSWWFDVSELQSNGGGKCGGSDGGPSVGKVSKLGDYAIYISTSTETSPPAFTC